MTLRTVLSELQLLVNAGIVSRYAIGGAVGATRYVEPAATEDVDVFVTFAGSKAQSLDPLQPIYEFLKKRGGTVRGPYIVIGDWPVQFLPAEGALLVEAMESARDDTVDGIKTRIFTPEHLAALALDLGRAKDKLRIVQFVEGKALDRARFEDILARHGLMGKWNEFRTTILGES